MSGADKQDETEKVVRKPSKLAIALGLGLPNAIRELPDKNVAQDTLSKIQNAQNEHISQDEQPAQPARSAQLPREMDVFPLVAGDKLFPMNLLQFLSGVRKVVIRFNNGRPITDDKQRYIQRILSKSGGGTVSLYSEGISPPNKNEKLTKDMISLKGSVIIDHRMLDDTRTQYTILGGGGKLWVDGDSVTMFMEDGREISFEEWHRITEAK